ncbi:MAG: hypothetical protein U5R30_09435 [Deltaproteobacteria bacterium]|nr:hypothetical protein [Deltaproteobacteria bacterium]
MPTLIQTFQYFLVLLATLMGINACMIYFAVTFSGSLVFGVVLSRAGGEKLVKQVGFGETGLLCDFRGSGSGALYRQVESGCAIRMG